jgi:hypothetical protein
MNNEVLDLQKTVQPEIPICHPLCTEPLAASVIILYVTEPPHIQ